MKMIKSNTIVKAATMAALILTAGFVFSQEAVTAKGDDLQVPPSGYAAFDSGLTQAMIEIFNSPIMKAVRDLSAGEMGEYTFDTLKISYFTTDRSIDDVTAYFSEKLGQEAEIETSDLVDSPEEMREMEEMTGLTWTEGFMDKYEKAHEEYMGEESRSTTYNLGSFPEKMVTIEIESPYLDPRSFKKVDKTSIMYMVMTLKKK